MDCPDKTRVALFVQGELPPEDGSRFEAHLDICESCLALIAEIAAESTARSLGKVEPRLPPDSVFVHLVAALARRSDRSDASDLPVHRERLGPYRVIGTLGRGAMGIVYRAIHDGSGQEVAIKTVAGTNPKLFAAVRQEIAFLEHQRHPGVVQILENGVVDGDPWYAMELLSGTTLEDFNRTLWRGAPKRAAGSSSPAATAEKKAAAAGQLDAVLALFTRICAPLGFIHHAGIVHCDLKPANIFIRHDGQPVLMDFGLLSRAGGAIGRESLEVGGRLRGTLPYISPELIRGKIPDARADLYALGCILYESVTGRPPFIEKTANGLLEAHLRSEPIPASELVLGVPRQLDELLAGLLAKRPDQRIGDAGVVADLLTKVTRAPESPRTSSIPSTPYLFRPRMVGREAIVEQIQALRAEAERGQGHFVLVSGESGIGKTFLASEIAQRAARAGFEVVTGECTPVAPTQQGGHEIIGGALEPFRKLLQNASDRCRDGGPDVAMRLFGSELSIRLLARYEPGLAHLLGATALEDLPPLPPAAERERLLQALSDVLVRVADETPLLLIIDDLQWADDLSLAFLDVLSANTFADKRLLLVGLYRSEEGSKPLSDLEKKEHVHVLQLGRLDSSALTVMVGDLLSDDPPVTFVQALAAHSEGNPFFVAEYLRAAAAEGRLERTTGGWRLAVGTSTALGYEELTLPRSLRALLERRLASLSPAAQRVTEAAALLGRDFHVQMLSALVGGAPEDVLQPIAEMLDRQVVQQISADNVRFLHDKMREAAYARLDSERRNELHLAAGNVIEATYAASSELPARYAEIAYHLQRGGDARRAVDYFEKAGEHALRFSAGADAVRFFAEASHLVAAEAIPTTSARRAHWARMTGDALRSLGDLEASKGHLLAAVALLGWPMPGKPLQIALAIIPSIGRQILHRTVPRRWIEAAPEESQLLLEGARAYDRLQQIYYYRGEYLSLFLANLTTLNLSERALPSSHLAAAYTNAGAAAGIMPMRNTAARYFALAERTLEKAYDAEVESYLRLLQAVYLTGLGEWDRAVAACDRSLELARQLGFRRRWEEAAGVRFRATRDFDEGLDWASRTLESARKRSDPQTTCWGLVCQAEVLAARGYFARASEGVAQIETILSRLGPIEQMCALGTRCFLLLADGKLNDAASVADRAADLVKQTKPIHLGCIEAYTRIAQVQLASWTAAPKSLAGERRRKARAACADLAAAARIFPIAMPSYCLHEGARRWISGQPTRALAMWQRGVLVARHLGLHYREAQLLLTLGKHQPRAVQAEESLALGGQIAARLGIGHDALPFLNATHEAQ